MFVKDFYVNENEVVKGNKNQSPKEVYDQLKQSGYRCIPVVSETGDYEGMIFKVHLLEHFHENETLDATISELITNEEIHIRSEEPFIEAVSKIKAYPFLPVVEDGKFKGILTHNKVMDVLEDIFGLKTGGINFTVSAFETTGVIERLGAILKDENVEGFLTLDTGIELIRRVVFTVKNEFNANQVEELTEKIEQSGFRVVHVKQLDQPAS